MVFLKVRFSKDIKCPDSWFEFRPVYPHPVRDNSGHQQQFDRGSTHHYDHQCTSTHRILYSGRWSSCCSRISPHKSCDISYQHWRCVSCVFRSTSHPVLCFWPNHWFSCNFRIVPNLLTELLPQFSTCICLKSLPGFSLWIPTSRPVDIVWTREEIKISKILRIFKQFIT